MSTRAQRSRAASARSPQAPPASGHVEERGWTEFLPAHELHIDERYQRDINPAFVGEIAENLDYGLLQTISVARRPGPTRTCDECGRELRHTDYVMDGQHRVLGIRQRGLSDLGLRCEVQLSEGSAWEADQYLRINFLRKAPTAAARYKAAVHAGESHGWVNDAAVNTLLTDLGIAATTSTNQQFSRREVPAVLAAVGSVCRFHEKHADLVAIALTNLRDAWSDTYPNAYDTLLLSGMMDFWAAHEDEAEPSRVTQVLAALTPDEVRDQAEQMRGNRKYPTHVCVARVVAEAYNAKRAKGRVREISPAQYGSVLRVRSLARSEAVEAALTKGRVTQQAFSAEQRREIAMKGQDARSPEQRRESAMKGAATRRSQQERTA